MGASSAFGKTLTKSLKIENKNRTLKTKNEPKKRKKRFAFRWDASIGFVL
jgi:hypothetical protein